MRKKAEHSRVVRILRVLFYRKRYVLVVSAFVLMAMAAVVWYADMEVELRPLPAPRTWAEIEASDTLRVVAVPSSYTVFSYKDQWYGHEYNNVAQLAEALGLELKIILVKSDKAMVDSLFAGAADLAITPMSYKLVDGNWFLRPTGPRWTDPQCIVAARKLDMGRDEAMDEDGQRASSPLNGEKEGRDGKRASSTLNGGKEGRDGKRASSTLNGGKEGRDGQRASSPLNGGKDGRDGKRANSSLNGEKEGRTLNGGKSDSVMWSEERESVKPRYRLTMALGSAQWMYYCDDSIRAHYDLSLFVPDTIPADSLTLEQLTDSLMEGKTDAVMMRLNVARLMRDYYPSLVVVDTLPMSMDSLAWMVTSGADTLRMKIDSVTNELLEAGTPHYTVAMKRYREQHRHRGRRASSYVMRDGGLSPYDQIFRGKGEAYELDWRLLAATAYIESNFRADIVSKRGPIGLMQLMPQTVAGYGYTEEEALEPENNVEMAAKLMASLYKLFRNRVPGVSDEDLMSFALAGYNAGIGHVYDAIRLAETLGYQPHIWSNNVEHCLRLKSDPQYYKMSVVKSGQFNGAFTINYVNEVTDAYHTFCAKVPKD